jgi:tetratricopeptide (TPR) repeat protein
MHFRHLVSISLLAAGLALSQEAPAPSPAPPATGGSTSPGGGAPGGNLPGGGFPGNTPGNIPGGNTRSPFPDNRQQNPDFDRMENRPIFLSGKVRMEDGSAPPESVTIERVCLNRGTPIPEGYTDSKGNFSFQLGQRLGMMPDASINEADASMGGGRNNPFGGMGGRGAGMSQIDLTNCEIRANLPGYRSTIVSLAGRRAMDNPDLGTLILKRLGDVVGFTTSATSLLAPKDARKSLEKARAALKKNKLPDAQKELELAVAAHPKYAEAWYELGRLQMSQKQGDAAKASYLKAIEADDKFVRPYLGLAALEAQDNRWVAVKQLSEKIIKLNRYDFPLAFLYGAVASYNLQDAGTAEKLCRAGIEIDQYHTTPKMSHLLGMILASRQDYKGASEHLSSYIKFAPQAGDIESVKKQLADINGRIAQTTP